MNSFSRRQQQQAVERRATVAELTRQNVPVMEQARQLKVCEKTIRRDRLANMEMIRQEHKTAIELLREKQLAELVELRNVLKDPRIKPDRKVELTLAIIDRESRIGDTNPINKSIVGHVSNNPEHSREYLLFKKHTADLDAEQLEDVYKFASSLKRKPVVTVRDASWYPAPMRPLLEEGEPNEVD